MRTSDGTTWRGGLVSYTQFERDARRLLNDTGAIALTTMIDLFRLPTTFPGYQDSIELGYRARVAHLERSIYEDIGDSRFLPYLSTHEFEALLFSATETVAGVVGASQVLLERFAAKFQFLDPESINALQPPSHRLRDEFSNYDKVRRGPIAAARIGIDPMRDRCPHFNEWLASLEAFCDA